MAVYAFSNTYVQLDGPFVNIALGAGAGDAEGGITVTMTEDKNTMTIGADGEAMHSLHSGTSGTVTVRLLKTSPTNAILADVYDRQTSQDGGRWHGQNTIVIRDMERGDHISCSETAFSRMSEITYAKEGGEITWTFHCAKIHFILGRGWNNPLAFMEQPAVGGSSIGQVGMVN